jgi:phosphoribosylformylglycinamidine (FGAM) synthase-like enzyme
MNKRSNHQPSPTPASSHSNRPCPLRRLARHDMTGKVPLLCGTVLAQELKGTDFQLIMVEGHTDRLGSSEYNQTLSQERAEAVKNYLVNTGGIAANKISAVGKSESMPVTRPEDCKGQGKSAALISCLKADRRVEVEVQAEISAKR